MATNIQYNQLDEIDGSIRLEIQGKADFITARRINATTVHILDTFVAPANEGNGFGKELVETLLQECTKQRITRVEIKTNENPSWWEKAKQFRNGHLIKT